MKTVLVTALVIHGIVHLLGFAKAFRPLAVNSLTLNIPKPLGILWMIASLLFLVASLAFIKHREWWPGTALTAVLLSQLLIFLSWNDAKAGTVLNLIILGLSLPAYGYSRFDRMAREETAELLSHIPAANDPEKGSEIFNALPPIVKKWIRQSGTLGGEEVASVRLKQKGRMRIKSGGKWMSFSAVQYFNTNDPSFIWTTRVKVLPAVYFDGRDKLYRGEGEMLIRVQSLFNVVNEKGNEKINSGSMLRFLAETAWFPAAGTNSYLSWEAVSELSARANFTYNGEKVSGLFTFSENGDFLSFEAPRYMGSDRDAKEELWVIEALDWKNFNGHRIPSKCNVTWKLAEGDHHWLELEITDLEYNNASLY